ISENNDVPEVLKEQAEKFLQDPSIKGASREKKAAFLESKGVKKEDIDTLLKDAAGEQVQQQVPSQPYLPPQVSPTPTSSTQSTPPSFSPRDVPPVITYPEFLVHANKPAPLVTTNFLVNTAYITAGLYATVYGLSKYIIAPMEASLTQSRHDILIHTTEQLENFNEKLSSMVSTIPQSKPHGTISKSTDHPDDASDITNDSDPTELYHRDFGTQTSPTLSRRPSSSSEIAPDTPADIITGHSNRIRIMASHLKDLEASNASEMGKVEEVGKQLTALNSYLNDMSYSSPYYRYSSTNYSWNGSGSYNGGKDDEIEKLKTEIRSVKGVLLSTRTFPRGKNA
ncbi:hypothetical protein EJ08DRAFT_561675, partial [Tothia fuscella]